MIDAKLDMVRVIGTNGISHSSGVDARGTSSALAANRNPIDAVDERTAITNA
jgi:hypothetical protein